MLNSVSNTRNFSIIANVDAGKSSISDNILAMGGLIKESDIGVKRGTDTLDVEKERGITVKSTGVSVNFSLDEQNYRINMIDSPGHADFNQNTQSAIRITDGALVLVDVVEGVQTQTVTVLRQALADRVKPVLVINKFDRLLFELQMQPDEVYTKLVKIIYDVNQLIEDYQTEDNKWIDGDLSPVNGTVIFSSAYHNWGFDILSLAKMYNPEKAEELCKYMFGDYFVDTESGRIVRNGTEITRVFCQYVYNPIKEMTEYLIDPNSPRNHRRHFKKLGYDIDLEENETKNKDLYKKVFKKLFHLGSTLKKLIAHKLPNPIEAQHYRASVLYSGLLDETDQVYQSIKQCDPNGPVIFYVTLMVPTGEGGRFYAFGRIFSGTLRPGQKVTVLDSNYEYGSTKDIFTNKSVQRVVQFIGAKIEAQEEVTAGNIVAIQGIDNVMTKSGTVTTLDMCYPIKTIKFTVSPVVQVSVKPKNGSELQKLLDGMKRLEKSDPVIKTVVTEARELLICATGDLHLELSIEDLIRYSGIEIIVGEPVVSFREAVVDTNGTICLAKSSNKHNRIWLTAEPLNEELVKLLESGELNLRDSKKLSSTLTKDFKWDPNHAKKVWAIGPFEEPTNMLVDCTIGAQGLNEVKDGIIDGFTQGCLSGIIAKEKLRGIRFNLVDIQLHVDRVHRNANIMAQTMLRSMRACQLCNGPTLCEPLFKITICTTKEMVGTVYSCISYKKGTVINEETNPLNPISTITGFLPVLESFGFDAFIKEKTSGQAFTQLTFDKWEQMRKEVVDDCIKKVRVRKGMNEELPLLSDFLDKL